jgi:hypothetical protein
MSDAFLQKEDWGALVKAALSARRGQRAYLSAAQAERLVERGYMARAPRDPTQIVITASGRTAAANYERSLR